MQSAGYIRVLEYKPRPGGYCVALSFICLLISALILRAVPDWEPLSKGASVKALLVTLFAGMMAAMAMMAYANPAPVSTGIQSSLR